MNRRKFLSIGGFMPSAMVVAGIRSGDQQEEIPQFENGGLLTAEALNRIVDRINLLEQKGSI